MRTPPRTSQSTSSRGPACGRVLVLGVAAFVSLGLPLAGAGTAPRAVPAETRALWVVRTALVSSGEIDRVVDQAADAGFNTLLVQVRGRGDSFYSSSLVTRSPLLSRQPASFDPLRYLLVRARARGLCVHAWFNVLLAAHFGQPLPAGHILETHPEWMMVPRSIAGVALRTDARQLRALVTTAAKTDTDVEGLYLSPSSPAVADHLTDAVQELVASYPIDGLHLDFVRYPGVDYDYSRSALESFKAAQGGRGGITALASMPPFAFAQQRQGVLTRLVGRLAEAARRARPGVLVSAAVVPGDYEALALKGQAWGDWLDKGLLDVACPMAYAMEDRAYAQQLSRAVARGAESGRGIWVGIGAWRLPIEAVVGRVRAARTAGAAGIALFSHESLGADDRRRLRQEAFPAEAPSVAAGDVLGTR